jgi:hypothetical protein
LNVLLRHAFSLLWSGLRRTYSLTFDGTYRWVGGTQWCTLATLWNVSPLAFVDAKVAASAWRRRFGNKEGGDEFRCLRLRRALCRFGGTVCLMQSETYGMRVPHGFDVHVELFPRVKEAFLGGTYNILVSLGQEQVFVVRY